MWGRKVNLLAVCKINALSRLQFFYLFVNNLTDTPAEECTTFQTMNSDINIPWVSWEHWLWNVRYKLLFFPRITGNWNQLNGNIFDNITPEKVFQFLKIMCSFLLFNFWAHFCVSVSSLNVCILFLLYAEFFFSCNSLLLICDIECEIGSCLMSSIFCLM